MRLLALTLFLFVAALSAPGLDVSRKKVIGDYISDPIVIGICIFSFLGARRATKQVEERRFWDFLSLGFIFWLTILMLGLAWSTPGHTSASIVLTDTLFLAFYLAIFVSIEARPHRADGWSQRDRSSRMEATGAVVFVLVLLVYAVLIPSRLSPEEAKSFIPSLAAYLSLDILLLGRILHFRATCTTARWKSLYGWLAVAVVCTAVNDFRELVAYAIGMRTPRGNLWDLLWYPPLVAYIGMARLAVLLPAQKKLASDDAAKSATNSSIMPQCTLAVYSFLLPIFHFVWYGAGFLDPSLRDIRELVMLGGLLILGTLTIAQYFFLDRQNFALRQQLARAEENLNQSRRMEAVGRLAGGVAHDFNNLLMIIRGYSEILQDEARTDASHRATNNIVSATDRAVALTKQLLAFSRKQVVAPAALELNAVIAGIEGFLRRLLGNHIKVQVLPTPDLWTVLADRGQLEQVLMNLAANARDAMPEGGTFVVRTSNAVLDSVSAERLGLPEPGEFVLVEVKDNGAGMSDETRSRIFEPFYTTKETGKGTGLGLATAYAIVQQYGGAISVESVPGLGAKFSLYFPRTLQAIEPPPQVIQGVGAAGSETILLVEDEHHVRSLAREFLAENGYAVLEAGSPIEALDISRHANHSIDLVVTDVIMPGMSGREMAGRLNATRPQLKVLFMSGHTDDAVMVHGVAGNTVEFLQKPFTRNALLARVRSVLG